MAPHFYNTEEEIDYFLKSTPRIFPGLRVTRENIVFRFSGVRPLPHSTSQDVSQISRDHSIEVLSGDWTNLRFPVYSLVGGKWTTFRAFSEQVTDKALAFLGLSRQKDTRSLQIGGGRGYPSDPGELSHQIESLSAWTGVSRERLKTLFERYGTRAESIATYMNGGTDFIIKTLPDFTLREIVFLVQHEKICHLDDFFLRRSMLAMLGRLRREVVEELARVDAAAAITLLAHNLCSNHIFSYASMELKKKYLAPLAAGEKLGAWALTEPEAGSDAGGIRTTARPDNGAWILNGNKFFITNGSRADTLVVMASTDSSRGSKGITAFIEDGNAPGLRKGKNLDKLGFRASDTVALFLDNVRIPGENLLGGVNMGFVEAMGVLDAGRVGLAAMAVGIARGCLEESIAYARKRHAFGQPIADFQAIQWMLADMATEVDAARLLVRRAARLRDEGKPFTLEASMAKLFSSETAMKAALKAVQIHGGHGYIKSHPVERYLREAKLCEIGEGTSEIQRMVIAREILENT